MAVTTAPPPPPFPPSTAKFTFAPYLSLLFTDRKRLKIKKKENFSCNTVCHPSCVWHAFGFGQGKDVNVHETKAMQHGKRWEEEEGGGEVSCLKECQQNSWQKAHCEGFLQVSVNPSETHSGSRAYVVHVME